MIPANEDSHTHTHWKEDPELQNIHTHTDKHTHIPGIQAECADEHRTEGGP